MAEFTVTGPDGKTYDVTAPDGTSEAEVLARVRAEVEKSSKTDDTRNIVTRTYQDYIAKPATNFISEVIGGSAEAPLPGGYRSAEAEQFGRGVGQTVVPQTPTAAGAAIGTAVGGPYGALMRILGGTAGAGAGSALEGHSLPEIAKDAGIAGAGAATVETLGKALPWLYRGLSGQKQAIGDQQAARLGEVFQKHSPGLGPMDSSAALRDVASGAGKRGIGQAKEVAIQEIESLTGNAPIQVGGGPVTLREANDLLSAIGEKLKSKLPSERTFAGRDAVQAYKETAQEIERGLRGIAPEAAELWLKTQQQYESGMGALKVLRRGGAFMPERDALAPGAANMGSATAEILRGKGGAPQIPALLARTPFPGLGSRYATEPGVTFNAGTIQAFAQTPQGKELLTKKFGPDGYAEIMAALFPGKRPYEPSNATQALLDMLGIRLGEHTLTPP